MTEGPFGIVRIVVFMEKVERRESEPARKREVRSRSHKNRGSRRLRQFLALCRGDTEVRRNAACQHLAVGNPGDTLRDGDLQEQNTGRKRNQNGASYSRSAVLPRDISVPAFFLFFFGIIFLVFTDLPLLWSYPCTSALLQVGSPWRSFLEILVLCRHGSVTKMSRVCRSGNSNSGLLVCSCEPLGQSGKVRSANQPLVQSRTRSHTKGTPNSISRSLVLSIDPIWLLPPGFVNPLSLPFHLCRALHTEGRWQIQSVSLCRWNYVSDVSVVGFDGKKLKSPDNRTSRGRHWRSRKRSEIRNLPGFLITILLRNPTEIIKKLNVRPF